MKRFCIVAFLAALGMTGGCRLFEPEPPPVVYYPTSSCCPSYSYQACPQGCVPAAAQQCVPASATPTYVRPSGAAPGQLNAIPSQGNVPPSWPPRTGG
jgi:hypothetical protein